MPVGTGHVHWPEAGIYGGMYMVAGADDVPVVGAELLGEFWAGNFDCCWQHDPAFGGRRGRDRVWIRIGRIVAIGCAIWS